MNQHPWSQLLILDPILNNNRLQNLPALKSCHHLEIELGRFIITLNIDCPQQSFQNSWAPYSQTALTPPLGWSLEMETLHYGRPFPFLHSPCPRCALFSLISLLFPAETLLPWGHSLDIMLSLPPLPRPSQLTPITAVRESSQQKCLASSSVHSSTPASFKGLL